jgi:hypothetical protein
MIGAAPLHETQIVRVVYDPGEIGILKINADVHDVTAVAHHAVEL